MIKAFCVTRKIGEGEDIKQGKSLSGESGGMVDFPGYRYY